MTDALVPPPESLAATPATEVTKQKNIMEEEDNGLTDKEKMLQKEEEEYAICIGMLSD